MWIGEACGQWCKLDYRYHLAIFFLYLLFFFWQQSNCINHPSFNIFSTIQTIIMFEIYEVSPYFQYYDHQNIWSKFIVIGIGIRFLSGLISTKPKHFLVHTSSVKWITLKIKSYTHIRRRLNTNSAAAAGQTIMKWAKKRVHLAKIYPEIQYLQPRRTALHLAARKQMGKW